ncbi:MAG: hypothetical protein LBK13_02390 [Spirochaetales bacterium]|nr:hypothetical protein [Spirochaetales bacterium]
MKKVIVERRVVMWDELSAEQKEKEIEKLINDKYGLQEFFDGAYECYDSGLRGIENKTLQGSPATYKAVKFIRDKVSWRSGSQGWYYDHCGPPDFLVYKDFYKNTKRYCLDLQGVITYRPQYGGRREYNHSFDWYLSVTEAGRKFSYTGDFADIQAKFENERWDIPIEVIRMVNKHERQYCREFDELKKRIENEIEDYNGYWPDEEEIGEYFRSNETEFVISEDEIERAVM